MEFKNVLPNIERHLAPTQEGKQERGEVFTPPDLIDRMFGHLPSRVWKDPTLKWVDPAAGVGNFAIVAFFRLDKGLATVIPSAKKRRTHIIEQMLHLVDIDAENCRIARSIFRKMEPAAKPNIHNTNSLAFFKAVDSAFDIVVGNPPFNAGHRHQEGRSTSILEDFVEMSIRILTHNGHLAFVLPQTWRNAHNPLLSMLRSIDTREIVILNDGFYPYPMDYIHAQKRSYSGTTTKRFLRNGSLTPPVRFDIQTATRITNGDDSLFERAVRLGKRYGQLPVQVVSQFNISSPKGRTFLSETKTAKYQYPIVRNLNRHGLATENIVYSAIPHPAQTALKVLISNGAYMYPHVDAEHGTSQNVYFVLRSSKKEADDLVEFLGSDIVQYLFEILKVGHYGSDYRDLALLPDPAKVPHKELATFLRLCKTYECKV